MAKGDNNRDAEERNEDGRSGRGARDTGNNGNGYPKGVRREGGGRGERIRGEGGGRRRDRKPKESPSGSLTTPTPDHLPKSFYQAPVILERKPQATSPSQPSILTKKASETSAQTSRFTPVQEETFSRVTPVIAPRVEIKSINTRGKSLERPFVKMVNEKGMFNNESVLKVGVFGPQGSGKSTVISTLCQDPQNAFSSQSIDALNFASHETIGIDIHVTPEKIPISSLSVLEHAIRNDYIPENMTPEVWLELQSLQLAVFLFSVCNVVIVVTESIDYSTWNFLKKAEMLKYRIPEFPTVPSLASTDNGIEYYPDIEYTTVKYDLMCDMLIKMFQESNLKIFGTVSLAKTLTTYKRSDDHPMPNLFLLPFENQPINVKGKGMASNHLNVPDTFLVLAESMRDQIFELPKKIGKKGQVSEKEWFRSAMKAWDLVRKSEFITDYVKFSHKLRDM
ncbi:16937_t:CDS:2 [Funneliformis mosseae]|uniref:16937_t:CDS:1 n=1 Tax=Funneliformis mosseae TaxID=27381 RepID=A0A9N8V5K6_FUNMO|nr:16937_t:CDS:2 [Funneliformis mosseae]